MKKQETYAMAGVNSGRGFLNPPVSQKVLLLPVAVFFLNVTSAAGEGLLNYFACVCSERKHNQIG